MNDLVNLSQLNLFKIYSYRQVSLTNGIQVLYPTISEPGIELFKMHIQQSALTKDKKFIYSVNLCRHK